MTEAEALAAGCMLQWAAYVSALAAYFTAELAFRAAVAAGNVPLAMYLRLAVVKAAAVATAATWALIECKRAGSDGEVLYHTRDVPTN